MAIVATTQDLRAGKVQPPQGPSVLPAPCQPALFTCRVFPTALGSDPRLEGLLLRWQVTEGT